MSELWQEAVVAPLRQLWEQVVGYLPQVSAAIAVVVVGAIAGWVTKQVVYRGLRLLRFDQLANRLGLAAVIERVGLLPG